MRLRRLSEAECYARCYGGRGSEHVTLVRRIEPPGAGSGEGGERLGEVFEAPQPAGREAEAA